MPEKSMGDRSSSRCFWRATAPLGVLLALLGTAAAAKAPPPAKPRPTAKPAVPTYDPVPGIEKAAALRAVGKFEEALDVLRNESREVRKVEGEETPKVLLVNDLAAEILLDQSEFETAEALLGKTIASREALVTAGMVNEAPLLGKSFLTLAKVRMGGKRTRGAIDAAVSGLPLLDKGFGPQSDEVRQVYDLLGAAVAAMDTLLGSKNPTTLEVREKAARQFEAFGQFDRAIAQEQRIVEGYAAGFDAGSSRAAEALTHLAGLMGLAGRADDGIAVLRKASTTASDSTASRQLLLADLQLAANRFRSAKATIDSSDSTGGRATAAVGQRASASTAAAAATQLRQLLVSLRQGHADALPDWFSQTIRALITAPAAGADAAVDGLLLAGDILITLDDASAAIEPLAKAVSMAGRTEKTPTRSRRKPPPKPPTKGATTAEAKPDAEPPVPLALSVRMADAAGRLAAAHLATGDAEAARLVVEPALKTATEALGPGDARSAFLRVLLADAVHTGDATVALAEATRAIDYGLPRPDDTWEERVSAIYDRLAAADGKDDLREQYIAARARQFGEQHRHVAFAWSSFGNARLAAGDWAAAVRFYSQSLELQQAILGTDHPDVAATRSLLAHAMRLDGNATEAAESAAQSVSTWERIAGANHPGTLAALDVLATTRIQAGIREGVVDSLKRLCAAPSITDPVRRSRYLIQLAEVTAKNDRATAITSLHTAMKLPCWAVTAQHPPTRRLRLAATAARASRVFNLTGDPGASTEAIQKARALVLDLPNARELHEQLDRLASPTGQAATDW